MHIQIHIHEQGYLQQQRHAFSNRFTLVSELLQNARRAGATRIALNYEEDKRVLTVHDDGHGVADFQNLLSLHQSGWDVDTCEREQAFGVGFMQCLYAATRCVVESGRQMVDFDTAAALARQPVEVQTVPRPAPVHGTCITLYGVDLPGLVPQVQRLCRGFAVPVWLNWQLQPRPFAESALTMQDSPIGRISLAGQHDGEYSQDNLVFLQGLCVLEPSWQPTGPVNVVHLDPRLFVARMPDRDRLIDEDLQRRRIADALKACWRQALLSARAKLPPAVFVERFYAAMRHWGHLDLLNDLDVLPPQLVWSITGYPVQDELGTLTFTSQAPELLTRQAIEEGSVRLVSLDDMREENAAHWMLARHRGWLVFDWLGVHSEHWVLRHVRHLQLSPALVHPVAEQLRTTLEGRVVYPVVVLCGAVRLQVGDEEALITDAGVAHRGCIYIPAGEVTGEPVRQHDPFVDDKNDFMDSACESDREALADLLFRLRSVDPVETLKSLLVNQNLGKYPILHGKTFSVSIGVGARPGQVVTLVAESAEGG